MTQSLARAGVPTDALELLDEKGSAERALTVALASFQEQVQAVPSLDLAAVVEAARPAFASGIAFSAQLVDIHGRNKLRVTVMLSADNEVGRSATSSLAGGVSAGEPGADAQGPGDAGTTDQSPT
ncbi:hypothetical protein KBY65_12440, partial [Cyanobium sp. Alchichica 3B3-8F6]